jgi:DNA-binding CsgD family transcriptional regulator
MAARMAEVAAAAHRRGSLPAASRAYEQAAKLTIDPLQRADHQINAAWTLVLAGDHPRARDMAAPLIDTIEDPVARARMAGVLGVAEMWLEGPAHVIPRFELHGRAVRDIDPGIGAILLLHSAAARMLAMDLQGARDRAQEATEMAQEAGDPTLQMGSAVIGMGFDLLLGRNSAAAAVLGPLGRQAVAGVAPGETTIEGIEGPVQACAYAYIVGDDVRQGIDLLRPLIHLGDARVLNGGAMFSRLLLVDGMLRLGWWADALAEMSHLISLQRAVGLDHLVPVSHAQMARVEAGLGLDEACREHAAEAIAVAGRLGIEQISSYAVSGLGLLELGAGRFAEAAEHFDRLSPRAIAAEPGWLWWEGDAIEALFRAGRTREAERALARLEVRARASGRTWAQAVVLRSSALLDRPGAPAEERYGEAIARFRAIEAPFEEARTRLLRGEHRLREGEEADGAVDLAAARTVFDRLGARAWSTRASSARGEVTGAGRSLQSRLTEAELRVALAVGHGLSNRQAAEELFLSIKTVDFHLQGIYRKLGVRNRTQLAAIVLASAGG